MTVIRSPIAAATLSLMAEVSRTGATTPETRGFTFAGSRYVFDPKDGAWSIENLSRPPRARIVTAITDRVDEVA